MLKKVKLKNSAILFLGIVIILAGIFVGSYEYLKAKKDKAFSKMNLMLYESETPKKIVEDETDQVLDENIDDGYTEEPNDNNTNESDNVPLVNNYIGILEIPKLNLKQGFFGLDSPYNNVDHNITVIKGSTFPTEENNNLILAAHSGNCAICYFKTLYKLVVGDIAYLTYDGERHSYKIVNIYEVEKNGTVAIYRNYNTRVLTLITCTKNNDYTQTVYILEIQN